jgi:hypothetical protein
LAIGRTMGWHVVKSTLFDMARTAGGYRVKGRGRGHGVGLCVTGASALGAGGRTPEQILDWYFPGLGIETPYALSIVLPAEDERHRPQLESLVRESIRSLASRARILPPGRIELVVYPTTSSYQRATGRMWWTSGSTSGHVIHLPPLGPLLERRRLADVVRHELAHVLLDQHLRDRPLWVREGAALHFSGEAALMRQAAAAETGCPGDRNLLDAPDLKEMQRLYAASSACFERALAAAGSWQGIGKSGTDR